MARDMAALGRARNTRADPSGIASPAWRNDGLLADMVLAARSGDEHAFEELAVTIGPPIYRYLLVRLGSDADARDALQETLLAAWLSLRKLRRPESFRSWILTIATRKAAVVDLRREAFLQFETHRLGVNDGADNLVELQIALASLPRSWHDILVIRYVAGLSEAETARALSISVGTVKSRAARARHRLATLLREEKSE